MFIVLLSILGVIALLNTKLLVDNVKTHKSLSNTVQGFSSFVQNVFIAENPGDPTPYSQSLEYIAATIQQGVTEGVKHSLTASLGGTMKGVNAELREQAMQENPSLAIMEGLPKSLKKNPLIGILMQNIANSAFNAGKNSAGNGQLEVYQGRKHRD